MVVTGDRDAYQLVDDGVRIMTTSRGITDTRVYDRDGVLDRYGIPPELIPDFIGLKGDTSDNIPGVPGIGDKTAAELLQRFGSLEEVLNHIDDISGAKRKQNLTEHAEAARISKQLATAKRDIPVDLDLQTYVSTDPDRSKLQGHVPASSSCVSRCAASRKPSARPTPPPRRRRPSTRSPQRSSRPRSTTSSACRTPRSRSRSRRPTCPTGALFAATDQGWRFAVHQDGAKDVLTGATPNPEELVAAIGTRPAIAHDAKSLGEVPATLAHDTEIGAYLLEPARRRVPVPRAVRGARSGDRHRIRAAASDALLVHALAQWQRDEIRGRGLTDLFDEVELPLVRLLRKMEQAGLKLDTERLKDDLRPRQGRGRRSSSARSSSSPARSSRSARPSSSRRSCSESSASPASAAARPATRPTPACSRRSGPSTR